MNTLSDYQARVAELEYTLEAKNANLRDMAIMGSVLTSIHEIETVLPVVMEMAIGLAGAEVGLIMLESGDELRPSASWGINHEFARTLMYQDGMDLPTYCFSSGETVVLSELGLRTDEGMSIQSIIALPIKTSEKCFGAMLLINKTNGSGYSDDDKEILELLLNFAAVAIENSNLIKDKLDRLKIEQEMSIAKQIQETILPQDIDDMPGAEIGAVYFPAREVGGDFYGIRKLDDKRFVVILGDVSNKGVPAALVMSAADGIIKSTLAARPEITVSELASTVNNLLCNEIIKDREMFVTLFFSKFDLEAKKMTYCNAGHLPGLFWSDEAREICELAVGGPIIGQFADISFEQGERPINSGDRLFLFTDGLTEAADSNNQLFGRERAEQVFSAEIGRPPKEFCLIVKEWVDRFAVGCAEDTIDDFTILQVRME
ncbi:MAG: SpoIIE family protein phosphatase [candidate division Zixibacteria bacterium]|nr:SpoIIE family protein phosphatase [candidate division Zixibacteria bacterium]